MRGERKKTTLQRARRNVGAGVGTTTRTDEKHLSECLHVMPSNAINKRAITNFNQRQIQQVSLYRLLAAPAGTLLLADSIVILFVICLTTNMPGM